MTQDINAIMAGLPPFLKDRFNTIVEGASKDIHPSSRGGELAYMERDEPRAAPKAPETFGRIVGELNLQGGEIKVYSDGQHIDGTIELPGLGKYWMHFNKLIPAEGALSERFSSEDEKLFGRYLYQTYIRSMYDVCVTGEQWTFQYRFAASPMYDERNSVAATTTFAILLWKADKLETLLLVNGTDLHEIPLKFNERFNSPRAPKWLGKVPALAKPR